MGYDTDMTRAYDTANLGWMITTPACGSGSDTVPYLQCDPANPGTEPEFQLLMALLDGNLVGVWNLSNWGVWTAVTPQQIEQRETYNTNLYSQGNEGHEFTSVLTDDERKAIIEYLKTL
jgi:endo-cleaving rubber dioxygenase